MADPASYRPEPGSIPDAPGVYRFRDPHGRVVYVGKAKSLRARLSQYFIEDERRRLALTVRLALRNTVPRSRHDSPSDLHRHAVSQPTSTAFAPS